MINFIQRQICSSQGNEFESDKKDTRTASFWKWWDLTITKIKLLLDKDEQRRGNIL